ncbi:MAG: NAD(P)-dependent oxidoreductase [Actinobacteria bacterium]|nr:NAD(P)-dependent oxidoreductase [Actinomycetota bacterium]
MAGEPPVLVTGGTGFIGTYVVRALLESGRRVVVFDIRGLTPEGRFTLGDLADAFEVEEGSIDDWSRVMHVVRRHNPVDVVHLATITHPVFLFTNPMPGVRVNFEGTIHVLEASRLFDIRRIVYFSSIGVLPAKQYEPIDAAHPIFLARDSVPTGVYGASKIAAEAFCSAYNQAFGTDFRTVRPSAVYGFGMQWPIFIKPMVEGAVRGEVVTFESGGPFPRDYTHAADLASLAVACLDAPDEADRIFYGATGEPLVTAAEVARIVMELVPGSRIEIPDTLTEADQMELPYRGRLSIDSNRSQLGWEPRFRDVRDGIADYVERYRAFVSSSG